MLDANGNRMLAYIEQVCDITPIEKADRLEAVHINGWICVCGKGEFHVGDKGVFFEIDSKLPEEKPFSDMEFLVKKHYKIKTQKIRGEISQGLFMPLSAFEGIVELPTELHADCTELLKVTYSVKEDNKRKAKSVNKYQAMYNYHPKFFKNNFIRKLMKYKTFKDIMFFFFGRKKENKDFPVGKFEGVNKTDQERCLVGDTKIYTDQGIFRIADIVNKHLNVKVLSYNHEQEALEYKPILSYQKYAPNPKEKKCSIEYSYRPGVERVKHLICTPDHKIFTSRGYIRADEINTNDMIYMLDDNSYSGQDILAVVYGMLLGDSHIGQDKRSNGRIRIGTTNGSQQLEYLRYKQAMFDPDDGKIINAGIGSYGVEEKPVYKYFQDVDSWLDQNIKQDWLDNDEHKKHITQKVINKLTEASLAFWYMDDGNLSYRAGLKETGHSPSIRLNTQSFSKEEVELLINMLIHKFNIQCNIRNDKGWIIYISTKSTLAFLKIVTPYMCPSMAYKTLPELESLLATKTFSFKKGKSLITLPVLNVDEPKAKKYIGGSTYDLEIEDNHNFIAQGILTHNCENMTWVLQDKTPFIVTQKCDGSSGTYILERKSKRKFEFYVCSRNKRILKPTQKCYYDNNYYWDIAIKYDIENKMKDYLLKNPELTFVCWQGEICAPGIQKNPHHLKENHFYCFHMTDSKTGRFDIREAKKIWDFYNMETVPIVDDNYVLPNDFEDFKATADGYYDASVCEGQKNCLREGYVYYKTTEPTFSFKNVSRKYLLKQH